MPGIAGIASSNGFDPGGHCIDQLIMPMMRRRWFHAEKVSLPGAALANISLKENRSVAQCDQTVLVMSGELAETPEFSAHEHLLGSPDRRQPNLSETLLSQYLMQGVNSLCGLNGYYVIAIWEDKQKKLTIVNDRYGFGRLYYWRAPDRLLFASEYKSLSEFPGFHRKIDEVGLSDLLFADHLLDDRTLFEDIHALPGASILTYQDGKLSIQQYWDYHFSTHRRTSVNEEDLLEGMATRLHCSIERRVRKNACILLTGGLDSRAIAGMWRLAAGGMPVLTNTIGLPESDDVKRGEQIARRLGFPHFHIPAEPDYLARYAQECVIRTEGNMNCHASWIFAEDSFLLETGIDYAITGLFGEAISGRNWTPLLDREISPNEAAALYEHRTRRNTALLAEVLRPEVYARVKGESINSIRRTLARAGSQHPLNMFDYMHMRQKIRRHSGSADTLGDYAIALDPFTDNDLVDYVLSIPPQYRLQGRLFKKMIARYLPAVAEIGYGRTGAPLKDQIKLEENLFHRISARGLRLIRRKKAAPRAEPSRGDPPGSSILYNEWMRTASKQFILDVLGRAEILDDYFNMPAVNNLVSEHMRGLRNDFQIIGAILTFAIWRRQFCQGIAT